jgi:hypothetical protein
MEVLPDDTNQEESTLKPWIDPHQLKCHGSDGKDP